METTVDNLVEAFPAQADKSWMPFLHKKTAAPTAAQNIDWYEAAPQPLTSSSAAPQTSAAWRIRKMLNAQDHAPDLAPSRAGTLRLAVKTTPLPLRLPLAAIKIENGQSWDCDILGTYRIQNPPALLEHFALGILAPDAPLTSDMSVSLLISRLRPAILDVLPRHTIDDLRNRDALPAAWWQARLDEVLAPLGLAATVASVRWASADADRAATERRRQQELQKMQDEARRAAEEQIELARLHMQHEQARLQIEHDARKTAAQRDAELKIVELEQRRQVAEQEQKIESVRRAAETAGLQHELSMAMLRQDKIDAESFDTRRRAQEQLHAAAAQTLQSVQQALHQLSSVPDQWVAAIARRDQSRLHQILEDIVSPYHEISAAALNALGYPAGLQALLAWFTAQPQTLTSAVRLTKNEFLTRAVSAGKKINLLKIGDSLAFNIATDRAGFLTLLNLGTSGKLYLQIPSALCPTSQTQLHPGQTHRIPGPPLLPCNPAEYLELGPPGWEHLVAIVSDAPLLTDTLLAPSTTPSNPSDPILEMDPETWKPLWRYLNENPHAWSAGVLSFKVEE